MCDPSIFKTLAYSESKYCQQNQHIHNAIKHLSWNNLLKFFCNADIFRTLLYSPLWYILKNKHIQNPTEYVRWSILLWTLCNYSIFRRPIYSKHSLIQNAGLSATPQSISCHWSLSISPENIRKSLIFWCFRGYRKRPLAWNGLIYQLFFRTTNLLLLLYPLLLIKSMTYSLAIRFFSQSLAMR